MNGNVREIEKSEYSLKYCAFDIVDNSTKCQNDRFSEMQKIGLYKMDQNEQPQFTVFKTVLGYSIFILASPVITFFFTKFIFFEGLFGISSTSSNVWSAVLAVVVLHIALGMYIYRAYSDSDRVKVKPAEKVD